MPSSKRATLTATRWWMPLPIASTSSRACGDTHHRPQMSHEAVDNRLFIVEYNLPGFQVRCLLVCPRSSANRTGVQSQKNLNTAYFQSGRLCGS